MTSKYQYQIEIARPINEEMLLELLNSLQNGSILEFPQPLLRTQFKNSVFDIEITACGYVSLDRTTKVIKLTNSQRRQFIKVAQESLDKMRQNPKESIIITVLGNEYINNLLADDY